MGDIVEPGPLAAKVLSRDMEIETLISEYQKRYPGGLAASTRIQLRGFCGWLADHDLLKFQK